VKEKRKGPIGRAAELAEGVAATVRRMQREREPRVLVYDETGYARLVQPDGRGYELLLETAERMVVLVEAAEADSKARRGRRAEVEGETGGETKPRGADAESRGAGAKPRRSGAKARGSRAKSRRSEATAPGGGAKSGRSGAKARGAGAKSPRAGAKPGRASAKSGGDGAKPGRSNAKPRGEAKPRRTRRATRRDDA
jgi:hypothetical protein